MGAKVPYHARQWHVHVASAFPLAHHYREVLAWLAERNPHKQRLFYGKGRDSLGCTAVRILFLKYLVKAGLSQKGPRYPLNLIIEN